jgi:hypothetical protein
MSVGEKFFKKCKELGGDELVHVDEETIELNMKRIIKELFKSKYIEM